MRSSSAAFLASIACSAFSISESTSPMPSILDAILSGWKGSIIVQLFAHAYEFYRLARDVPHRKRGAAPRVAVELCEDDARYVKQVVEALCDVDGILTGHRIDRKQYLRRLYRVLYAFQLGHELLVHVQTARRVNDDRVEAVFDGVLYRLFRRAHGVLRAASRTP